MRVGKVDCSGGVIRNEPFRRSFFKPTVLLEWPESEIDVKHTTGKRDFGPSIEPVEDPASLPVSRRSESDRESGLAHRFVVSPLAVVGLVIGLTLAGRAGAQEVVGEEAQVFSGPQVGEPLGPLVIRRLLGEEAGKEVDPVTDAAGSPIVLVFVHDINRQSVAMTRILTGYTHGRAKDGLATGVIFLDDDATAAQERVTRMKHALTEGVTTGVSVDGREGPGSYGLNRNVTLTILVGKGNKVTANYALVQPSLQVDLPKILASVIEVAGGKVPDIAKLPGMPESMGGRMGGGERGDGAGAPNLRPLLGPLIRLNASEAEVDRAAEAVEAAAKRDPKVRAEVGRVANTIIDAGKLEQYGTPKAQEYLRKWAAEYGRPGRDTKGDPAGDPKGDPSGDTKGDPADRSGCGPDRPTRDNR